MLLGLHGKAGSGKDQSYQYIREWAESEGRPVRRDAFADRLKVSAARALGHDGTPEQCIAFCNGLKEEDKWVMAGRERQDSEPVGDFVYDSCVSGRSFLQRYGTEAHREVFGQGFWTNAVLDGYDPLELLVVTDVRFPNEAEAIHKHGGQVWQILRGGQVHIAEDGHASEIPLAIDHVDHVVLNNGSLDRLRGLVQSQVERLIYS